MVHGLLSRPAQVFPAGPQAPVAQGIEHPPSKRDAAGSNPAGGTAPWDLVGARLALATAKFWSKVDRAGGPDACWPWLGRRDRKGHARFRRRSAQRFACVLSNGHPPTPEMHAVHAASCVTQSCCNGSHLSWGVGNAANQVSDLWAHIDRSAGPSLCWPWTGGTNRDGYGVISCRGFDTRLAHRIIYETEVRPIPAGLLLRHAVCGNPPCCNPGHLEPGTSGQNSADMVAMGRSTAGERHPNSRLTNDTVLEMRTRRARGEALSDLAERFGVVPSAVSAICLGKTWRHIALAVAIVKAAGIASILLLALSAVGCESAFWPSAGECRLACSPRPVRSLINGACVCDSPQPDRGGR